MARHPTIVVPALIMALACPDAVADCFADDPGIIWTFPSDGQQDVAVNASIFVLTTDGSPHTLLLDGVAVPRREDTNKGFDPGILQPDHLYTATVVFDSFPPGTVETFSFRTSSDSASQPAGSAPVFNKITSTPAYPLSESCNDVLWANGCYDQGENTYFIPEFDDDGIAWILHFGGPPPLGSRRILWPQSCGSPIFLLYSSEAEGWCMVVGSINAFGIVSPPSDPVCLNSDDQDVDSGTAVQGDGGGDISPDAGGNLPDAGAETTDSDTCTCATTPRDTNTFGPLSIVFVAMNLRRRARSTMHV